ncbi:MAG: PAS domain-containing protein [Patescibacteria group bacterium]|nr:PAS domain-containing protein [Patescibacteria group bacterium]
MNFWIKAIHPDNLCMVRKKMEPKLKEKKYNATRYKCRIVVKSGEIKWVEVFSKNFYHNDRLAILLTMIEIPKPSPLIELSTDDLAKLQVVEEFLKIFDIPYRILKNL